MSQLILVGARGPQGKEGSGYGTGSDVWDYSLDPDNLGDLYYHDNGNIYLVTTTNAPAADQELIGQWKGSPGDKGDPGDQGIPGLVSRPLAYGADIAATAAANDAAFASMVAAVGGGLVDLDGKSWPVTEVPNLPGARNGFWRVENFDEAATVDLPAPGTIDRRSVIIEGGQIALGWPQGTPTAYNGVAHVGYLPANGHAPGPFGWSEALLTEKGRNVARFRSGQDLGMLGDVVVFGATIIPPETTAEGPKRVALASNGGLLEFRYRDLPEYSQDVAGGAQVQAETEWTEAKIDTYTLGHAVRVAVDSAYSVTTSGIPTLATSPTLYGSQNGMDGHIWFGFHGLSGAPSGPYVAYIAGRPKDGNGALLFVARIGLLASGVEPSVCWFKNGGSSRLCGFVRSQGAGYPIRFWATEGLGQSNVEGANVQDCPFGNDFATYSPINCAMRPRRKGTVSGWLQTWETVDGTSSDELHFVFTGRRTRDGGPGDVWLYWGRVTKGSGNFDDMWSRAQIVPVKRLYFANTNNNDTSNQVGTPDLCWIDANTLLLTFTNERPAVGAADQDESYLECMTISLRDTYADAADRVLWDDGAEAMADVVKAPEYVAN